MWSMIVIFYTKVKMHQNSHFVIDIVIFLPRLNLIIQLSIYPSVSVPMLESVIELGMLSSSFSKLISISISLKSHLLQLFEYSHITYNYLSVFWRLKKFLEMSCFKT
jgi:hypothetical protein